MSLIDDELAKAEDGSVEARKALAGTVVALQSRLKPSALARDAINEVKELSSEFAHAGAETIKRHPLKTVGIVAAITAFVARKPLSRLFRRKPTKS